MGYTSFSKDKVQGIIDTYKPKSVMDFGSQNDFSGPDLPAPYISEWYKEKGMEYTCIDSNAENGALVIDLTYPIKEKLGKFPLVVDCGVMEHLERESQFSWEAVYNGWLNKHNLCRIGGIIYSENPKTESWPGHGYNYHTEEFYKQLAKATDYEILDLGEHPACHNIIDGWNIYCTLKKGSDKFPTLKQFSKFSILPS